MIDITMIKFAVLADCFHCPVKGEFAFNINWLLLIDHQGNIAATYQPQHPEYADLLAIFKGNDSLQVIPKGEYLLPGLVDLHCHAPQWPQAGKGLDLPLYDWLQNYTFPLENRYSDNDFAANVYQDVTKTLLANGTTSAVYFASIHRQSTELLAQTCLNVGQRAFVGKVNMDNSDQCPAYYCEPSVTAAIDDTELFVNNVFELAGNQSRLVHPVITPRFVPSCTSELLQQLGGLVQRYDLHMQTHCSESDWARDYSIQHYGVSDVTIYADMGLLNNKSILAHSIFLNQADIEKINQFKAGIGHCPLSNMYFANAAMPARELLDHGVQIGLGSDIAGAPSPSIFRASFDAVSHSRVREEGVDIYLPASKRGTVNARISFVEAFWMATVGGGQVLDAKVGLFEQGYHFDAIVIKANSAIGNLRIWPEFDSAKDILEKIITLAQPENVAKVWVQGKAVI
ncbi:amidohydrolase family protein [Photobacterium aquimaris]|uniref:Guanine deaminase n=1 Tax=Photobacterium aquimaris TaxID=512643 RepID=A0A2T3HWJ2_9GAMM|nr:amidohydrolase family protein [Photobacterium aquimaris]OBU20769.1 guanine deaminase [Photobacterium aquimaris]PQJ38243.1 guanine deaminase [Photobacterium aquimaris]PSU03261.1 guanine deaminase [Photobacterium aquimaris]